MVRCRDTGLHFYRGKADIQEQLDGATRNKSIYTSISRKLHESGYECDWLHCRAKFKNLKVDYKKVKDYNGGTGKNRRTCKFFKKLDAILGCSSSTAADEPSSEDGAEGVTGNGDGKQ